MPEYTVVSVDGQENWATKDGNPMIGYFITIRSPEGAQVAAKTNRRPATAAPSPDEVIDGTLDPPKGNHPPLLRKNFDRPKDGGGGYDSPQKLARIARNAAQVRAIAWAQVQATLGTLPKDTTFASLAPLMDALTADVEAYVQRVAPEAPKTINGLPVHNEPQQTGLPDVTTPSADYAQATVPAGTEDIPF